VPRLTIPQWRILENARLVSVGEEAIYFPRGQSQHGGWICAETALKRKGLLDWDAKITEAGLKALQAEK
jgi:hypothetical protein